MKIEFLDFTKIYAETTTVKSEDNIGIKRGSLKHPYRIKLYGEIFL
jgi:hypothetical protein